MLLNLDNIAMKVLPISLVNTEQLSLLLQHLRLIHIFDIPGDVVEMGCFVGGTSIALQRLLSEIQSSKILHVYDSFEGLPLPDEKDTNRYAGPGSMKVGVAQLEENFDNAYVKRPVIHKGWFNQLTDVDYPDLVAFAFIDADYHASVLAALESIYPRLAPNAVCFIHDHSDGTPKTAYFPGVDAACAEFFYDKPEEISIVASMGYFFKQ